MSAPNPPPAPPPGLAELTEQVIAWLKWGVLAAGVIGLLLCAGMIILGRRQRSALAQEGVMGSVWVLAGLALASVAAVLVSAFAG